MRRIKGLVAVLLAVCTVFSVTGCDTVERIKERISQETVDEEKVADENKTEVSNSLSVGLLDFDTFNPLLTKSETVKECMEFVYEPLFELNEKLQAVPILAESYTVSPDGRTIDITLKNNIQWQDGSNFNAYDVAIHLSKYVPVLLITHLCLQIWRIIWQLAIIRFRLY